MKKKNVVSHKNKRHEVHSFVFTVLFISLVSTPNTVSFLTAKIDSLLLLVWDCMRQFGHV
jgi:hypothetical protein